ncbi:MAG TPA: DUF1801 domain-containing protein [Pyrinomonadaceae bacterium]|jgi:hypothetical protein
MAVAEIKTKQTEASVEDFFNKIKDENVRRDTRKIAALMQKATGDEPKMWGESIVGFGYRRIKSPSGREVDWMKIGLAPRKANITLYLSIGETWDEDLLSRLGKHKTGMGCLYVKRLSDIDENVLQELIEQAAAANSGK